jgi:WD40 repeat protein
VTRLDHIVHDVMDEMAGEVSPADFVRRAESASRRLRNRRRLTATGLASVAILAAALVSSGAGRRQETRLLTEPPPPRVLDLAQVGADRPGRIAMLLAGVDNGERPGSAKSLPFSTIALDAESGAYHWFDHAKGGAPLSLSADGTTVMSARQEGAALKAVLKNVATGALVRVPLDLCRDYDGFSLSVSPDGKQIAVIQACAGRSSIKIIDAGTGQSRALPYDREDLSGAASRMYSTSWSPDGTTLAVVDGSEVVLYDVSTFESVRLPLQFEGAMWSADSQRLLLFRGGDKKLIDNGMIHAVLDVRSGTTQAVTAPPNGQWVAGWDTERRLVWVVFPAPGEQDGGDTLRTAELDGSDVREWFRFADSSVRPGMVFLTTSISR